MFSTPVVSQSRSISTRTYSSVTARLSAGPRSFRRSRSTDRGSEDTVVTPIPPTRSFKNVDRSQNI